MGLCRKRLGNAVILALTVFIGLNVASCGGLRPASFNATNEGTESVSLQSQRLVKRLDSLESLLRDNIGQGLTETGVLKLATGTLRDQLFRLQALAEIYRPLLPELKPFLKPLKELEDTVAKVRDADDFLRFAKRRDSKTSTLESLKYDLGARTVALIKHMRENGWDPQEGLPALQSLRRQLSGLNWSSLPADQEFLMETLCNAAIDVDSGDWDVFKSLNAKRGLHSLKKALRDQRLPVEILMGDALSVDKESCPRDKDLTALDESLKRKQIKKICGRDGAVPNLGNQTASGQCLISTCYIREVEDFYEVLSDAKDEGEGLAKLGQTLSHKKLEKVAERWESFHRSGALRKLAFELSSCRQAAKMR